MIALENTFFSLFRVKIGLVLQQNMVEIELEKINYLWYVI
jgi:hypothetical protein